jgi:hypothetical protein
LVVNANTVVDIETMLHTKHVQEYTHVEPEARIDRRSPLVRRFINPVLTGGMLP